MKKAKRFVVTENGNIIDTLNLLKGPAISAVTVILKTTIIFAKEYYGTGLANL